MITNAQQLDVALQQISSFADTLEAMRLHAAETNSTLFPLASEPYIKRIQELNAEVRTYFQNNDGQALAGSRASAGR